MTAGDSFPVFLAVISWWHIAILLVIILLLFGGKKLPELAKGMARGMRIFRDELHGITRDVDEPPAEKPKRRAVTRDEDTFDNPPPESDKK